jgi:hypothetical protein
LGQHPEIADEPTSKSQRDVSSATIYRGAIEVYEKMLRIELINNL